MGVKRLVLITGARGDIGTCLTERLQGAYRLRLHNRTPEAPLGGCDQVIADIAKLDEVRPIMEGVDTVVHLAGNRRVNGDWESILQANVIGIRNVLEAAKDAGVRRMVFASSNHAMGMYDRDGEWPVYNSMPVRPDSYYGASKAIGEVLGRYYYDAFGLSFIALRIGWFSADVTDGTDRPILRAMWLSPRDTANVVQGAIETDVGFGIYYAISNNPDRRWDITNTIIDLGYRPVDRWDEALGVYESHDPGAPSLREGWSSSEPSLH